MKRLMLAVVAIFSFATMTFAQAKPDPAKKAKTETTKKAVTDTTHKKAMAAKKPHAKAAPAKKA